MADCLPFDSINKDRVYKAADWAWYFGTILTNGIFPRPSDGLKVIARQGMELSVNIGNAFINGYAFRNLDPKNQSLILDIADGMMHRIDRIVVRWDLSAREIYIAIRKGTASAKPVPADLIRNVEIWELALADVYVGKGVTQIRDANIKDLRFNSELCGIVTGTISEIDASTLTKQFDDFFRAYSQEVIEAFKKYQEEISQYEAQYEIDLDQYFADLKASIEIWLSGTQGLLDGDVAANLAQNKVNIVVTDTNLDPIDRLDKTFYLFITDQQGFETIGDVGSGLLLQIGTEVDLPILGRDPRTFYLIVTESQIIEER